MLNSSDYENNKILTISIAAYNAAAWLDRCLRSLVETSVAPFLDVIVVNDGSIDGTLEAARSFEKLFPDVIRVVDKENGGHGSTVNAAIEKARGKYFKLVDSDDWVEKDGIERLVNALKNTECDLVLNYYYEVDARTGAKNLVNDCFASGINKIGSVIGIDEIEGELRLVMHAMTFKTKILQSSPYRLDTNCFYVDNEYIVYYITACESVMLLNWPVYDYLLGTSEQSMNFSNMLRRRNQHERVCLSCIGFYSQHPELSGTREKIVRNCTVRLIAGTYRILLCLPYDISQKELADFDRAVRIKSPFLYGMFLDEKSGELVAKVIRRLRRRSFSRFRLINTLYRVKYNCTGETISSLS